MSAKTRRVLGSLRSYAAFFLLTAFIITCCMELFLKAIQRSTGLEFNEQNLRSAAVLTFVNEIFLSFFSRSLTFCGENSPSSDRPKGSSRAARG